METRKVCLIGDFGVGKTSLVARFVHQQFSEKYLTTIGVKIDTKPVTTPTGIQGKLVIWDISGTDTADPTYEAYLRGTAGYLLVADGTRAFTLDNALRLKDSLDALIGTCPFVGLVNKNDLSNLWEVEKEQLQGLRARGQTWLETSARTGTQVEAAFLQLAEAMFG